MSGQPVCTVCCLAYSRACNAAIDRVLSVALDSTGIQGLSSLPVVQTARCSQSVPDHFLARVGVFITPLTFDASRHATPVHS